jgi:hypothetical protein
MASSSREGLKLSNISGILEGKNMWKTGDYKSKLIY